MDNSKTKDMTSIYLLKFHNENITYFYTSLDAMFTAHSTEKIGVSRSTLYTKFTQKSHYHKSKYAMIHKVTAFNISDVNENLNRGFEIMTKEVRK